MYDHMRLTGLASGIDTDEMVRNLMQVERIKVDRVEQDRQVLLWRQEAYNSINRDFVNFILNTRKNFGITSVTSQGTFRPNSYRNLNWVKKASSSNESIAVVSSTAQAMDSNYKVNVHRLADGVSMASGSEIFQGEEGISLDGDGILRDAEGQAIEELCFTINGKQVEVFKDGGITMRDVANEINTTEDIGVRASYDSGIGRFFLQTTTTGEEAEISIAVEGGVGKDFIEGLNLYVNHYIDGEELRADRLELDLQGDEGNAIYGNTYGGSNALIDFGGATDIESSSNRITINGITMDLVGTGEFTVTVATDVDGVYDKIREFIDDYNELVDKANGLLKQNQYRNYKPLTAEQKKVMDKEEVELWEEKAKSGLLRNDHIIERTMLNIRTSLYRKSDEFIGPYKLLTEIGISTQSYTQGSAGGKLVIDEAKLKEAIAQDPEGVMEFLFKESTPEGKDEDGNVIPGELGGIVSRIYDGLMMGMEDIIKKSGPGEDADLYRDVKFNILFDFVTEQGSISMLDRDMLLFSRRIDDLNAMLVRKENSYYARFTAVEKAISRMNQQSMWLMQQFMG